MRKILCFSFTLFCSATFWTCDEVVSEQCELTVHKGQVAIQSIPVTYWRYRARSSPVHLGPLVALHGGPSWPHNYLLPLKYLACHGVSEAGRLVLSFSCECEPFKINWLRKAFPDTKVFTDMKDLHTGKAFDAKCQFMATVPKVDVVIDGYPCKSLSKQNSQARSFLDESSKSGEGFKALKDYVDYASPSVIICENVGVMAHSRRGFGGEKPIEIQQHQFNIRGYFGFYQTVNSKQFGLRQCRTRVYSIYVKKIEGNTKLLGSIFNSFKCGLLPVHMFLDHAEDPVVDNGTALKTKAGSGQKWKIGFKECCKVLGEAKVKKNMDILRKFNMPLTDREYAILAVSVTELEAAGYTPYESKYPIQVDQNFHRATWTRSDPTLCPCLLPAGKYVVSARWKLLQPQEKMKLQGVGREEWLRYGMETLSHRNLADLCGNSFSAPIAAAALCAALGSWRQTGTEQ